VKDSGLSINDAHASYVARLTRQKEA